MSNLVVLGGELASDNALAGHFVNVFLSTLLGQSFVKCYVHRKCSGHFFQPQLWTESSSKNDLPLNGKATEHHVDFCTRTTHFLPDGIKVMYVLHVVIYMQVISAGSTTYVNVEQY